MHVVALLLAVIELSVDASHAPAQNVLLAHETIPVSAGAMTLYYPEWIPGEHGPVGPVANLAGIKISGNGQTIPWLREPHNQFAIDFTVPQGVSQIDVDFTYLGATFGTYSSNRLASSNMAALVWNQVTLYPSTGTIQNTMFRPSLTLPGADWHFATALTGAKRVDNTVTWDATSLETLTDSPVDMGVNYKQWELWHQGDATAWLNVFADTHEELNADEKTIESYKRLVRENLAMYGARHWRNYNFLFTLSDVIPGEGIEHHESSDDGSAGDYFLDESTRDADADLLSHEFNHSWDGKYRMPAPLYPANLNTPYDDTLLWVYEGMTQYYGNVMSWRDGLRDAKTYPDHIAAVYASYDNRPGRMWRTLGDDSTAGPVMYSSPRGYGAERRGEDFYSEGELLWLNVDSIIREKTNNKKSLDTFAKLFFGGENTGPIVKTYVEADLIAALNDVLPYPWEDLIHNAVHEIAVHPPDGFTADGWKLEYTDKPTHWVHKNNFWYSIGLSLRGDSVVDALGGSPAWNAGLGFGTKIVAVNGRAFSTDALCDAITESAKSKAPITLIVSRTDAYRTVTVNYTGGLRYPHLVRIAGAPDRLMDVVKPLTKV